CIVAIGEKEVRSTVVIEISPTDSVGLRPCDSSTVRNDLGEHAVAPIVKQKICAIEVPLSQIEKPVAIVIGPRCSGADDRFGRENRVSDTDEVILRDCSRTEPVKEPIRFVGQEFHHRSTGAPWADLAKSLCET